MIISVVNKVDGDDVLVMVGVLDGDSTGTSGRDDGCVLGFIDGDSGRPVGESVGATVLVGTRVGDVLHIITPDPKLYETSVVKHDA